MIRGVIFDFGNVICSFDVEIFLAKLQERSGLGVDTLRDRVYGSGLHSRYERGVISSMEFHREVVRRIGVGVPAEELADLPVIDRPDAAVARVLGRLLDLDPELFSRVVTASQVRGDVQVDLGGPRLWLRPNVTAEVIRAVMAAEQVLGQQGRAWVELDGRFAGQVVVRGRGRPA